MCKYPVWTVFVLDKHVSGVIIYPRVCTCFVELEHDTDDMAKLAINIYNVTVRRRNSLVKMNIFITNLIEKIYINMSFINL